MAKAGKTHKSMAKRLKVTKKGKFMQSKGWKSHLLTNKGKTTTQRNKHGKELGASKIRKMKQKIKALIPFKLR